MRLLAFLLSAFLTVVLATGVFPGDVADRIGLIQVWLLSPVSFLVGIGLAYLFHDPVARFAWVLRLTAPAVAVLAALRGAWAWVPPLLVLGLVFHVVYWFARRLAAGRGFAGALRDARYFFEDLSDRGRGREPRIREDTGEAPPSPPPDEDDWPES